MGVEALQKTTVLVVDDNINNLRLLLEAMDNARFRILVASDRESALEQMNYSIPDIILLDIMMPGIDGFETCRRLKHNESTRDIPVIFMTALSNVDNMVFQIGNNPQRKGMAGEQGSGLGLVLCREFIKKHGGRIWLESEEGKGTQVSFTLPRLRHSEERNA